jgi:asparagine synthase (glutamine-hydrolysing)
MCGIAGWVSRSQAVSSTTLLHTVSAMAEVLHHRGPDGSGAWCDEEAGVALGHTRLAVIDLSESGKQPMRSRDGRYVLNYNGEIYNFRELRAQLQMEGIHFRGHSDTEVLLEAIAAWGVGVTLARSNGMFAFALWDTRERRLILARDRLGEKPLYYFASPNDFVFASELGAISRHPAVDRTVSRDALTLLLRDNNVPAPWSMLVGTRKLPPATTMTVTCSGGLEVGEPTAYWSLDSCTTPPTDTASDDESCEALEALLIDAVRLRLEADVPVGALLSGGIDSSIVAAMMRRATNGVVKTFTIGSPHSAHDESREAERVARHLGTEHYALEVSAAQALDVIPELPAIYSEPFADSSQLPTFLVSRLARQHVTVSLTGDGGDELFGGYNRHRWVHPIWRTTHRIPEPIRRGVSVALQRMPPSAWTMGAMAIPARHRPRTLDIKISKLAQIIDAPDEWAAYQRLRSHWPAPEAVVIGASGSATIATNRLSRSAGPNLATSMMLADAKSYLPDDILVKLDRASMAVGLEARVPLLDHRLVEFAFTLPLQMKLRGGTSKWLLRQVLQKHVPQRLTNRPKTGFGIPLAAWLRGPLKEWAADLLEPTLITRQGYFKPQPISDAWRAHVSRRQDRSQELWCILMFQQWLDQLTP